MLDAETESKILAHYQKGQGSIQDIARVYRVTVDDVLRIIGEQELSSVTQVGDLVDPSSLGPDDRYNPGTVVKVPYDVS